MYVRKSQEKKILKKMFCKVQNVTGKGFFKNLHIDTARGVFNIPCIFHYKRTFVSGTFLYEIILEPEKCPRKQKSQNGVTLFPETFYFKDFFHRTFLVPKFRTLFPKTFFQRTFFAIYGISLKINL